MTSNRHPFGRGRVSRRRLSVVASALLLATLACDSSVGPASGYERPVRTGDGWDTASLEQVGMAARPLLDLLGLIASTDDHLIHGLVIAKNGKLVFEEYWPGVDLEPGTLEPVPKGFDRETLHYVASVSKSLTSALAGIAIDRGLIGGVTDALFAHYPEYVHLRTDDNAPIVVEHLLSFTSGYEWNEFVYGFDDPRDSHNQMFRVGDPIGFLLARQVTTEPGSVFHYNSGDTNLLGEIVRRAAAASTLTAFAESYLFQPLGISTYAWVRFPLAATMTFASGGASLRPRDMAKLGQLYLSGGVWHGTRVVSEAWVAASTSEAIPLTGNYRTLYGYGYNWWLGRFPYLDGAVEYFRAAGWGGQDVFVVPALELVVVFTAGGYYEPRPLDVEALIVDYVFPAIVE
jgi:CubicO group peptidase (beta-lactamase class C family)